MEIDEYIHKFDGMMIFNEIHNHQLFPNECNTYPFIYERMLVTVTENNKKKVDISLFLGMANPEEYANTHTYFIDNQHWSKAIDLKKSFEIISKQEVFNSLKFGPVAQ